MFIFIIIFCAFVVYHINKTLLNLERKQNILYYNITILTKKIREEEYQLLHQI